jgi:hypothetical protein
MKPLCAIVAGLIVMSVGANRVSAAEPAPPPKPSAAATLQRAPVVAPRNNQLPQVAKPRTGGAAYLPQRYILEDWTPHRRSGMYPRYLIDRRTGAIVGTTYEYHVGYERIGSNW